MKNSAAFESVNIDSEDLGNSVIHVIENDYFWELKRSCFVFPKDHFPFGIQSIYFYMNNTKNAGFLVTSPGNAFAVDKKLNKFRYTKGMAEYAIEYTLRYSLNLDRDPCSEEASWTGDDCSLKIINNKIMDTFNCTAPWLLFFARYLNRKVLLILIFPITAV